MMKAKSVCSAFAVLLTLAGHAPAQSEDALLNKLVEKGVLTAQEAKDLRKEADKDFTTAYQARTGLPNWVTSLKFTGDLRLRYDSTYFEAPDLADWQRFRFRLRVGFVAMIQENFEVGVRLASGIGSPTSINQSFQNNASKKEIRIDLAYAKWTPVQNKDGSLMLVGGKMVNPFGVQELLFDIDYTPEGAAQQINWNLSRQHSLRFTAGEFVINEMPNSGLDPYLFAGQIRLDSAWSKHWQTSLGVMGLGLLHDSDITTASMLDGGNGNTRTSSGPLATLKYNMTPWQLGGGITYFLDPLAIYPGPLPFYAFGQMIKNPSAPDRNLGWLVGGSIGKAGRKGTWEINYKYRWLEGDAWWEEILDDDTFAVYGAKSIYGEKGVHPGTNLRSHILSLHYAPADYLLLTLRYYHNGLIDAVPAGYPSENNRFLVDLMWKF